MIKINGYNKRHVPVGIILPDRIYSYLGSHSDFNAYIFIWCSFYLQTRNVSKGHGCLRLKRKLLTPTRTETDGRTGVAIFFEWRDLKNHMQDVCRPRWLSWMRRPTGDQEVAGSHPAEVGNILSWRLTMKYFLWSFSPFRWFKKGSCQFLA